MIYMFNMEPRMTIKKRKRFSSIKTTKNLQLKITKWLSQKNIENLKEIEMDVWFFWLLDSMSYL